MTLANARRAPRIRHGRAAQERAVVGPNILHPVATRNEIPGRWAVGSGMTRPILAYLVIVTLGVWFYLAVEDVKAALAALR